MKRSYQHMNIINEPSTELCLFSVMKEFLQLLNKNWETNFRLISIHYLRIFKPMQVKSRDICNLLKTNVSWLMFLLIRNNIIHIGILLYIQQIYLYKYSFVSFVHQKKAMFFKALELARFILSICFILLFVIIFM